MVRQSAILIFASLVGLFACKAKQDRHSSAPINEITIGIAKTNVLMCDAVGFAVECPKQWVRFEALRSKATEKELLALTNDTNAVVRCYAFQALAARNKTDLFPIVVQHLSDTATITTLCGCVGDLQKAGDFYLETITEIRGNHKSYQLNEQQKSTIDSSLLLVAATSWTQETNYYTKFSLLKSIIHGLSK